MAGVDIEDLEDRDRTFMPTSLVDSEVLPRASKRDLHRRQAAVGYDIPGSQTIYLRTYGCAHNSSDGEYMAGLLVAEGYGITEDFDAADAYLLNSCTVKNPSEAHLMTLIKQAKATGKPVIVAGCVPQGDPRNTAWDNLSVVGVQQIHRVAEVVQEALRGNRVHLFSRTHRNRPGLDLPKIRRNRWIEIIPINVGCLNQCTYCKTKHARGNLSSWPVAEICRRVRQVVAEGVVEIRMTSEDTGAYGRDIGTNVAELLRAVTAVIPDGVMLRVGMTNPPYMLEHLDAICAILNQPNVFSYLHIPVQAGSNRVLDLMRREYTVQEFRYIVQTLRAKVPGINLATDIICGFPGETEEEFEETVRLCEELRFPFLNISQFYARQGTPAASMKPVDSKTIKQRSRRITQVFESYSDCFAHLVGTEQRVYVTELASDQFHVVGHTKCYTQVLLPPDEAEPGTNVDALITEASKWSVKGRVVRRNPVDRPRTVEAEEAPASTADETGADPALLEDDASAGQCCGGGGGGGGAPCSCAAGHDHDHDHEHDVPDDLVEANLTRAVLMFSFSALVLLAITAARRYQRG
eukprot:EG_transcript_6315